MTKQLEQAIFALRALPKEAQDAIAVELLQEVATFSSSKLTQAQHALVVERLKQPQTIATDASMDALFDKFQTSA